MHGSILESDIVQTEVQVLSYKGTCVKSCPQWAPWNILDIWTTVTLFWFLNVFFSIKVKTKVQCMLNWPQNRLFWFKLDHVWVRMIFHCLSKGTFLLSFHSMFANLLIESLDAHDDHLSLGARIVDWYCYLVTKSCPTLLRPHGTHQASLSIGFPREEYWSG